MTDKDTQLDKIERLAEQVFGLDDVHLDAHLFVKDGLYYEMRRELQRQVGEVRHLRRENRLYYELLYAVESKFQEETRHQTALKYIQEREMRSETGCPTDVEKPT